MRKKKMKNCCEFSKKIPINQIQKKKIQISIDANEEEKVALAKRFSIPKIISLSCMYRLTYFHGGHIRAQGSIKASIFQNCVISLEDFPIEIQEDFQLVFMPVAQVSNELEELDDPDIIPYDKDYIDVGEATAQQLALLLDPYPHKPNVNKDLITDEMDITEHNQGLKRENPFKILEQLKKK